MSTTPLRDIPKTNYTAPDDDYPLTANDILPLLMLDAVFPKKDRARLQAMACYALLVVVPTQAWAAPFAAILGKKIGPRKLRIISGHKVSGTYGDPAGELMAHLSDGKSIIAVTHDPATCITNQLKAALDRTVTVGPPTLRMIRKAIKAISGTYPSTLVEADVAGLEADDILSAMRKGSTATACVRRLRYAAELVTQPEVSTDNGFEAPRTESLPLPQHLRAWSQNLLADMARVKDGTRAANALPSILLAGDPGTGKTLLAGQPGAFGGMGF